MKLLGIIPWQNSWPALPCSPSLFNSLLLYWVVHKEEASILFGVGLCAIPRSTSCPEETITQGVAPHPRFLPLHSLLLGTVCLLLTSETRSLLGTVMGNYPWDIKCLPAAVFLRCPLPTGLVAHKIREKTIKQCARVGGASAQHNLHAVLISLYVASAVAKGESIQRMLLEKRKESRISG